MAKCVSRLPAGTIRQKLRYITNTSIDRTVFLRLREWSNGMNTEKLLQLIEHFVANYTPVYSTEPLQLDRAFQAGESLALPTPTIFQNNINMAGYVLRVCGDTIFRKNIVDATILALGNIVIEGESRNCRVFSMNSISVGRSEESAFISYGDFAIGGESTNSSSTVTGSIRGEKASIYGGNFSAGHDIIVQSAYNSGGNKRTAFAVGDRKMYMTTLRILNNYIRKLRNDLNDVEDVIRLYNNKLVRQPVDGATIPYYDRLKEQQAHLGGEIEKKRNMLDAIRQQAAEPNNIRSTITILAYASSNISIDIGGRTFVTQADMRSVEFRADRDRVAVGPARYEAADEEKVTFIEL